MILRKLIIENFRQIFGRSEIRFALPGDRNVTIILGQNGSGKTTLLNAFLWCLYNRIDMENPAEIVCHKAVQEAAIGERISSEVTLVLQDGPRSYTVKRKVIFQKLDGGALEEVGTGEFRVDVIDESGATRPEPDPRQFIQQLLPEGLRRFFFFRGEDMETLALRSSGPDLEQGVSEFFNFTLLDRAIRNLEKVQKDFEDEIRRISSGDIKRLSEDIAAAEEEEVDIRGRLENEQKNIQSLERQREEIERQLAESEVTRPLLEKKTALQATKASLELREEEHRGSLAETISRDGFLGRSEDVLTLPVRLADEAVRRGEIPAKIKPKFVDDLIASGTCVCGQPLNEHAKAHLIKWRGKDGLALYEEVISQMSNGIIRLQTRKARFVKDFETHRTAWAQTKEQIRRFVEQISAIISELEGKDFNLEEIRALQGRLRNVNDDLRQRAGDVARIEEELAAIIKRSEALKADRSRLAKDNEQTEKIQRRFNATEKVIAGLRKMRQGWLAIVQQYLDGQLKRNWDKVAQLDRLVEFTPQFRLSIKERGPDNNWTVSAPSSANLRTLALCFVSALIKLAFDIGVESKKKGGEARPLQVFQGGEYPLVMDAPFATMDKYFKRTVPAGLRSVVPQVVMFSNHDQWSGEVDEVLRSAVGQAYVLELHIQGSEDDNASIEFRGARRDYVVAETDAVTDWTTIKEVSP